MTKSTTFRAKRSARWSRSTQTPLLSTVARPSSGTRTGPTQRTTRLRPCTGSFVGEGEALLPLLQHPDLGVRAWAAAHALEFAAAEGEPVLVATADIPGSLVSFSAKMTLRQWREGTLRFP